MPMIIGMALIFIATANAQQIQQVSPHPDINVVQPQQNAGQPVGNGQHPKMTAEERVQMRVNKMKENLNLSNEQAFKVQQLFVEQEKVRTANQANNAEARTNEREKMMDELSKILTPEQMTKFKEMRQNQRGHWQGNPSKGESQGDEKKD